MKVTSLFISSTASMVHNPIYIISTIKDKIYLKITNRYPDSFPGFMMFDINGNKTNDSYFDNVDKILEGEKAEIRYLSDLKDIEQLIIKYDVSSWDGFNEHKYFRGVLDVSSRSRLFIEFSDNTTVSVSSYNSEPNGFSNFFDEIKQIIESQT